MSKQRIEILSVELLTQHSRLVQELRGLAKQLGLEFGWHYLLDLVWIIYQLTESPLEKFPIRELEGKRILDAGAGVGVCQWFLAEQGAHVISVDRLDRSRLSARFRSRYTLKGLRDEDLAPFTASLWDSHKSFKGFLVNSWYSLKGTAGRILGKSSQPSGSVMLYHQDLSQLSDLADNSVDAIVSVSALEHNKLEAIPGIVSELMRVLKPGGKLLATLCAARDADWFHEPSQGWCLTAKTLRQLFDLPQSVSSNEDDYDKIMSDLKECAELRDNLAQFYFHSGNSGMPWGIWDPQYAVVGVCKVKPSANNG